MTVPSSARAPNSPATSTDLRISKILKYIVCLVSFGLILYDVAHSSHAVEIYLIITMLPASLTVTMSRRMPVDATPGSLMEVRPASPALESYGSFMSIF